MTESDVYVFYNEKVKIIYSEIEARNNTLPVELLFEIHSAFDHLKRIHVDGEPEDRCAEKAFSHLKKYNGQRDNILSVFPEKFSSGLLSA